MKQGSAVLLLGAMLVSGAALASQPPRYAAATTPTTQQAVARTWKARGVISVLDAANKSLSIREGKTTWTFQTSADTQFLAAQRPSSWNDLKVGSKVTVAYVLRGAERIAEQIRIAS